jgi:hypothetical protein
VRAASVRALQTNTDLETSIELSLLRRSSHCPCGVLLSIAQSYCAACHANHASSNTRLRHACTRLFQAATLQRLGSVDVAIELSPGVHKVPTGGLRLGPSHSPSNPRHKVVWRAMAGARTSISGGINVTGWKNTTDSTMPKGVMEAPVRARPCAASSSNPHNCPSQHCAHCLSCNAGHCMPKQVGPCLSSTVDQCLSSNSATAYQAMLGIT